MTERQKKARKEQRQLAAMTTTFIVVMVLIVAIVVGVAVAPYISSYTATHTVAAIVGDHSLNAVEFNYFYIDAIDNYADSVYNYYYSTFGDYWMYMLPFDYASPLDEQTYDSDTGETWADYFISAALENAAAIYAIADLAESKGYTLSEDEQTSISTYISNLTFYAVYYYGYTDTESYLKAIYGTGTTVDSYTEYYTMTTLASSYYNAYEDAIEYTDDDLRAYEADCFDDFSTVSYAVYTLRQSYYLEDSSSATDEEKEAATAYALADAQILVNAGITDVDSFNEAIGELAVSESSSITACTEYSSLTPNLSSTYSDWLTEEGRAAGDMTYIASTTSSTDDDGNTLETTTGYYVLLYIGKDDNYTNLVSVRHILFQYDTDDDGEYITDDDSKAALYAEAEEALNSFLEGEQTEESFAELAEELSDDTGSNTNGGLYTDIYPGQMVDAFDEWCFDSSRQSGDTGIVETSYGYHVMYFVETQDMTYRDYLITNTMLSEEMEEWYNSLKDSLATELKNTSRVNTSYTMSS